MYDLSLSSILQQNNELKKELSGESPYRVCILSNITVNSIQGMLELGLRQKKINGDVSFGNFDNIVQDSSKMEAIDAVVIFWELANYIRGLHYRADVFDDASFSDVMERAINELDIVFNNLKEAPLVLINRFSSLAFNQFARNENKFDSLCRKLNEHLFRNKPENFKIVNVDKIFANHSISECVELRFFYSSKALYTTTFFKAYTQFILPYLLVTKLAAKKVLIFDCDNTLWKGILGEDGIDGINMSINDKSGEPFAEIQHLAVQLKKQGVLLGLCSKNNEEDVQEVFESHPDMVLKDSDISIKRVNWQNKVSNLRSIAEELNLGLDSIVFVDDSEFEVNHVRTQLSEVEVFQVPSKAYDYPFKLKQLMGLFHKNSVTEEDKKKTLLYQQRKKVESEKSRFQNIDDYLESLELSLEVFVDNQDIVSRLGQMTQKTNQFNLTTKRYLDQEVLNFVTSSDYRVIAAGVKDKFGDNGVTILCIAKIKNTSAEIDIFLMSCRVIGRNLEYAFFDEVVHQLKRDKIETLNAVYIKTRKNSQVEGLYEKLGFTMIQSYGHEKHYQQDICDYKFKNIEYINTHCND